VLKFQMAHAMARDAVHVPLDARALEARIAALGVRVAAVQSAALRRDLYLSRPDLGRKLESGSADRLDELRGDGFDVAIIVGDGLSSRAVDSNAVPLLTSLLPKFAQTGLALAPIVIAEGARVALGDEIGERLGARLAVMLIGERPGLSSPDSLGAYITYAPQVGRMDSERNCLSNIRTGGLAAELASAKIAWLVAASFRAGLSGVRLKDESDADALPAQSQTTIGNERQQ